MAVRAGSAPPPAAENGKDLGDNSPPMGLTAHEKESLYLTHLAQARKDNDALELAKEAMRAVQKVRKRNRNVCQTDGFILDQMDKDLRDELRDTAELEREAATRHFQRTTHGLPTGAGQVDMFAAGAEEEAPNTTLESRVRANGYLAGQNGLPAEPPTSVPPELSQVWLEEWGRGQSRIAEAWELRMKLDKERAE